MIIFIIIPLNGRILYPMTFMILRGEFTSDTNVFFGKELLKH